MTPKAKLILALLVDTSSTLTAVDLYRNTALTMREIRTSLRDLKEAKLITIDAFDGSDAKWKVTNATIAREFLGK